MEGLFSEGLYTGGFTEAVCNNALLKSINELDSITNVDDYLKNLENIVHLIMEEIKQVNSETRHLFGKPGDTTPWILNENIRLKTYKMVQRLADFLPENEDVRIKKETVAQPVNTYIGILKLKLCMTAIQIFATSFKAVLPMKSEYSRFQSSLTYIFNTALEIDNELGRALDSNRVKNFIQN
ncbi:MAG TPA: hypothetical protein DEF39_02695 [Hungateiclostridium thermocellum]|jgi:hypothetical protein|uniref:Uncharacterized protein n=2 Tax=Acetivibrio thermocellus TaxID=1515 RepID=A3DEA0_ACET2|nr:hypothetical protein [Acetivibrio thermocellus]CDG35742.1 hypothetical protein CTHBC1_1092 [Acetivibrio thermocellus BC1]ABN52279.1 hypothetical protein Cthe_1047 [Acetivibrio thermocellus ATCC 27405]ADU74230.1 hypothetical protein Clo1313_1166 [Acetivibrio thermocellus DSM 1313]ALX08174.1 hypothetical protein AD2_01179 [Acetivibrio thermocellus AD2]ANV75921.1 hypothetical protein LQRI_1180 [Acetivibrio thermocellus DSM 2360]